MGLLGTLLLYDAIKGSAKVTGKTMAAPVKVMTKGTVGAVKITANAINSYVENETAKNAVNEQLRQSQIQNRNFSNEQLAQIEAAASAAATAAIQEVIRQQDSSVNSTSESYRRNTIRQQNSPVSLSSERPRRNAGKQRTIRN